MSWTSFRKRRLPLNLTLTLILWPLFDQTHHQNLYFEFASISMSAVIPQEKVRNTVNTATTSAK
jgi:hypothetical protein